MTHNDIDPAALLDLQSGRPDPEASWALANPAHAWALELEALLTDEQREDLAVRLVEAIGEALSWPAGNDEARHAMAIDAAKSVLTGEDFLAP